MDWENTYYLMELAAKKLQCVVTVLTEEQEKNDAYRHSQPCELWLLMLADQVAELKQTVEQLCSYKDLSSSEQETLTCISKLVTVMQNAKAQLSEETDLEKWSVLLTEAEQDSREILEAMKSLPSSRPSGASLTLL